MGEEGSEAPEALAALEGLEANAPPLPPPPAPPSPLLGAAGAPLSRRWLGLLASRPSAPRWLVSTPWPEQLAEPRLACAVGVVAGVLGTVLVRAGNR